MGSPKPPAGYRLAPKPTAAYGRTFRSQLEARWAVFFTTAGTPCEYEPERLTLPGGRTYIPDFRIWSSIWCEVKPYAHPSDKALDLAASRAEETILLLDGLPDYRMVAVLGTDNRWAGIRADGQPPVIRDAHQLAPVTPLWYGFTSTPPFCPYYARARAFAELADFKNGKVIIAPRIRQTYAHLGEI